MKRQICFSLWLVVLYCAIAFAQQVPNKARGEVTDGNRIDNASKHEQLIRSTYKKLIEYNHAVQVRKNHLNGTPVDTNLDLKIELSDFHTGPIIEILNKRYLDLVTLPTGEVVSISRETSTINKGPEEVTLAAQWSPGQYASGFDPEWTIGNALRFEPTKYADVGTYTSYSAEVTLEGKKRKYQAIVLFHDLNQSQELGFPEFWDLVVDGMDRVWEEKRPAYKAKPELQQPPTSPLLNEDDAGSDAALEYLDQSPSDSQDGAISSELSLDSDSLSSALSGTSDFWLGSDFSEHASGSHSGTAMFTPTCTAQPNNRQRCEVVVTNFEAFDTGTLSDVFGLWFHKGVRESKTESAFGPAGTNVSCTSVAGVAFSSCLILTGCQVNIQVGANVSGGTAIATITGGNLWRDAHAVTNTCNLSSSSGGGSCTTPSFNGTCPPGSTPNGSGLCCFSGSNCGSLTFINKCFMYGGDYDFVSCTCSGCDACGGSPIVIDVNGDGIALTAAAGGVDFDLNGNGTRDRLGWTKINADDAWLALDRNGNGNIDNGAELFGDYTVQPAGPNKNGFLALAEFDKPANGGNSDGIIDIQDQVFSKLRLWQDSNHNGVSDTGELHTLGSLNVKALELEFKDSKQVDEFGNEFRYRAKVKDSKAGNAARWAWDVFLSTPTPQ